MVNKFMLGFGAVAAIAVAGVDYMVQAEVAGETLGQYAIGDYVDTYAGRYNAMRAERALAERQSVPAKTHLPEAPEGWDRRAHEPDIAAPFEEGGPLFAGQGMTAFMKGDSFLAQKSRKKADAEAKRLAEERVWEYRHGDEMVRLSAYFEPELEDGTAPDVTVQMAERADDLEGYATVKGVPFFRDVAADGHASTGKPLPGNVRQPLALTAQIGPRILLDAEALASRDSLRFLLERIDYDALNAMLAEPLADIGSEAPDLTPAAERVAARVALAALRGARAKANVPGTMANGLAPQADDIPHDGATVPDSAGAPAAQGAAFQKTGAPDQAEQATPAAKPARLQLSGGASCLEGSPGRFCRD